MSMSSIILGSTSECVAQWSMMASPSIDLPDWAYVRTIGQVRLNERVVWLCPPGSGGWVLASFIFFSL